jgi:zinc protease
MAAQYTGCVRTPADIAGSSDRASRAARLLESAPLLPELPPHGIAMRHPALFARIALLTCLANGTLALAKDVDIPFHKEVLENGLTVIVHEDHKAPIVAVNVWYHVGSKNETPGRTGFAHLFEHLMFQGSEHVREELFTVFESLGFSDFNGTTWLDRTTYYQTVPKNALDATLFLESDRMGHFLGAVTQDKLDEQRGVVQNEKRQRQNRPYGSVYEYVQRGLFPPEHPYSWETVGSMEDLNAASLEDVRTWFRTWYGPNNAVLVIAGDVETQDAVARARRYFGDIPPNEPVARPEAWIPRYTGTRRMTLSDRVPQPRLYQAWTSPQWGHPDAQRLALAAAILAGDKNSRLYERLVYRDQLATDVELEATAFEICGITTFEASPQPGVDLARLETVVREELERFARQGPTARELRRVQAQFRAAFVRSIEQVGAGNGGKAATLAENMVYGGRPDAWKDDLAIIDSARAEDLRRVVAEWLLDGAFVLTVEPRADLRAAAATGVDRGAGLPQPGPAPAASFPAIARQRLANGLEIQLAPRPGSGFVDLQLIFEGGYATDPADRQGLATMAMAMVDEGTRTRNALAISDELAILGASLAAGAQLDTTAVSLGAMRATLPDALTVFADVVLNPTFPATELERLRALAQAALKQEKNRPNSMALRVLPQLLYGKGHPYAKPLTGTGTEASLAAISRTELLAFHAQRFRPEQATLIAAGDITMAELAPLVERLFGRWEPGTTEPLTIGPPQPVAGDAVWILDRPGADQSVLFVGQTVPARAAAGEFALQALHNALGGQVSARINMNLREDKHWSYGAFTVLSETRAERPWFVYAPVQTDKTAESLLEVRRELRGIRGERPVTGPELARVQRAEVLALPGRWETAGAVLGAMAESVRYRLPDDYWQRFAERTSAVTPADVERAAREVVRADDPVVVIVGDRAKIEPGLRAAGFTDLRALDTDGNAL